jgi:hypothetical protein
MLVSREEFVVGECLLLLEVGEFDDACAAASACALFIVAMAAAISLPAAVRDEEVVVELDGGDMGVVERDETAARDDDSDDAL